VTDGSLLTPKFKNPVPSSQEILCMPKDKSFNVV
jgi:hypothetical protein